MYLFTFQTNKYVRVTMNVAMVCQTIIEPPEDGVITRDNIKCKISYTAEGMFKIHIETLSLPQLYILMHLQMQHDV